MNMILSADRNWGIGYRNELLFRVSADMKRFRRMTKGKAVIMGYNTLLSMPGGRPLKDRTNIILSRKEGLAVEGAIVCAGLDEFFAELARWPEDDVFVIGGEQIYRLLLPYCTKAYVTRWDAIAKADCFMENLDENPGWQLTETSEPVEENGITFTYNTYTQLKNSK